MGRSPPPPRTYTRARAHPGLLDVLCVNHGQPNALYLNGGKGAFHDITGGPLTSASACPSTASVAADLNADGLADLALFDAGDCMPEVLLRAPVHSFYRRVRNELTEDGGSTEMSLALDADGDGIVDVLDLNAASTPNALFAGDGEGGFARLDGGSLTDADVTSKIKMRDGSAVALDCDQDGDVDVFLSSANDAHAPRRYFERRILSRHAMQLHVNDGAGRFELRVAEDYLLGHDDAAPWLLRDNDDFAHKVVHAIALDANADGREDIFIVRKYFRNSLLVNEGNCTFTERFVDGTINSPEHAHAVALDIENDGDTDVFVVGFGFNNMVRPLARPTGTHSRLRRPATDGHGYGQPRAPDARTDRTFGPCAPPDPTGRQST